MIRLRFFGIFIIISMAAMLAYLLLAGRYYLHMFQLSSYYQSRFAKWQKKNVKIRHFVLAIIAAALTVLSCLKSYGFRSNRLIPLAIAALFLAAALFEKAPVQKKKMVYTNRVKRQITVFAVLYSVLCLAVLVLFVVSVKTHTVAPFLISYLILTLLSAFPYIWVALSGALNYPIEMKIQKGYKDDAARIMSKADGLKVIGITGSYGKTSSKYMLNAVLSEKYNTLMTPESYNTIMGVVKTIRSSLSPLHEVFIVEMGAKHIGEIKEIAELVKPRYSMITTVGLQHLESFGSEENITKAKFEIVDALGSDGVAFLNYDCDKIRAHGTDKKTVTFGFSEGCDYRAKDILCTDKGTTFTLVVKGGKEIPISTKLLGKHNVINLVSAAAIGTELGVTPEQIARAAAKLTPVPHRLELKSGGAYTVIDNAFNSNPVGAAASLEVLSTFEGYKKIIVTPGFIELGEKQKEESFEFGRKIAAVCDATILVGKEITSDIASGIKAENYGGELIVADTLSDALTKLPALACDKTVVLFENDLPDNYEPQNK